MAVAAILAGCLGADDEPRPAGGAARDFALICRDLFTAAARERAGGPDCARLTRSAAAGVERPSIDLDALELRGATARATVRTRAAGQAEVSDVLVLRRRGGEWRVEALGD